MILSAIVAFLSSFPAIESMTSISAIDSQLKQKISALRAASISLSDLPTPAKTTSEGLNPDEMALSISLKDTQSAPNPYEAIIFRSLGLALALTA